MLTLFTTALTLMSAHRLSSHLSVLKMEMYDSHLNNHGFDEMSYGYQYAEHGRPQHSTQSYDITCLCSISDGSYSAKVVYEALIIKDYNTNVGRQDWTPNHNGTFTCTIHDSIRNVLWLASDLAGSSPIWYSMDTVENGRRIIATTDLVLAVALDFKQPTPLGPGQIIAIDLSTMDIIRILHSKNRLSSHQFTSMEYYATHLLGSAMATVYPLRQGAADDNDSNVQIVIEIDPSQPSSRLLECATTALGYPVSISTSRALVANLDSSYPSELDGLLDFDTMFMDYEQPLSDIWSTSFKQVTLERWQICLFARSQGAMAVLLSFDDGLLPRPLQVYLQNLLCSYLGVHVAYPFGDLKFQASLRSTININRYIIPLEC